MNTWVEQNKETIKQIQAPRECNVRYRDWPGWALRFLARDETKERRSFDFLIAKFACPFCGEYKLLLDALIAESESCDAAECMGCGCALVADKEYRFWEIGDEVHIWW